MKIQKIEVTNFKAVSNQELDFNGCSAIITAGNNKGKSSILSGLISRLQGEKPELIVKQGEDKGSNSITLTDGSIIEWNFTEKTERLSFTTKDGIKQTTGVLSQLGEKFFGKKFDIDRFLNLSSKKQEDEIKSILGIDVSELEAKHKKAYESRTEANREVKRLRAIRLEKPEKVEKPEIEEIEEKVKSARQKNQESDDKQLAKQHYQGILNEVVSIIEHTPFKELFDLKEAQKKIDDIKVPELINIDDIENELREANQQLRKYDAYERDLKDYDSWVKQGKEAKKHANRLDEKVKEIEKQISEVIASAKMPEGFEFSENGLLYNGFPLSDNQQSSSAKYIASLKLAELACGEVRTLHFDASTLDNNSLSEVQKWAESKDLQLLIERPDMDGGQIKYEIINK